MSQMYGHFRWCHHALGGTTEAQWPPSWGQAVPTDFSWWVGLWVSGRKLLSHHQSPSDGAALSGCTQASSGGKGRVCCCQSCRWQCLALCTKQGPWLLAREEECLYLSALRSRIGGFGRGRIGLLGLILSSTCYGTADRNFPPWPDMVITACLSCLTLGVSNKEHSAATEN